MTEPERESTRCRRRELIGLAEVPTAFQRVTAHARKGVAKRRDLGLPTCGDNVPDLRKLTALMEEVGEVARTFQDGEPLHRLRDELRDVATCAALWAWAIDQELGDA